MKKFIVAILLVIVTHTGCYMTDNTTPVAGRGTVDINAFDICKKTIELRGEWEYYPSALLSPDELRMTKPSGGKLYTVIPGSWNPGWNLYVPGSGRGFATYRVLVKANPSLGCAPAVRIPRIISSYNLFINGKPAHSSGTPGVSIETTIPRYDDTIIPLPSGEKWYELVLQVANFHAPAGGIKNAPVIGNMLTLIESRELDNIRSVFLVCALLLLFLYQIFMFTLQREEMEFLYFGIFCLCTMVYSFGLHDTYWSRLIPFPSWSARYMIMSISVYIGLASIHAYLQRLLPLDVPRRLVYGTFIVNGFFSFIMLLLPPGLYVYMFPVLHADIICCALISIFIIVRSAARRRCDVLYVYIGLGIIASSIVFDILAAMKVIPYDAETAPWALLAMIILQISGMTREFIKIRTQSARLKTDNERLRSVITERIKERPGSLTVSVEEKINSAIDYLNNNFKEDISRENLAAAMDIHPDNFSRYFRQHTGKKYSEYINDLRIQEAIRLLRETDNSIITIAMDVGFNSLRTFNHTFLSSTGRTPGDFRKQ